MAVWLAEVTGSPVVQNTVRSRPARVTPQHYALFASAPAVGKRIHLAMVRGENVVYVPWFWRWIMAGVKMLPERVMKKLNVL